MSTQDKQIALSTQTTSLTSPQDMASFATTLKQFIVEQNLYTNIQGKNYVHVEAWQFCGAAMGVIAIVKSTERIETDNADEYKYRAEVELRRLENDQLVGAGIAFCSNKERTKSRFDEYAVASMAQTRATSKAYRIAFGWLMKVAGYEATPHEEMPEDLGADDNPPRQYHDNRPKAVTDQPSRNVVAENAKYMNLKGADLAAPSESQLNEIARLAKKKGTSTELITRGLLLIETSRQAEDKIAELKKEVGE